MTTVSVRLHAALVRTSPGLLPWLPGIVLEPVFVSSWSCCQQSKGFENPSVPNLVPQGGLRLVCGSADRPCACVALTTDWCVSLLGERALKDQASFQRSKSALR